MDLNFQAERAAGFKGPTQKIKILSEHWVSQQLYCPNCGHSDMTQYPPNRPVADFYCQDCKEEYELKSQGKVIGPKVGDGAYRTMIERLNCNTNPNLLLLQYNPAALQVVSLLAVPKYFFVPAMIEQRRPLSPTAKRAGWTGCNISLSSVPDSGRIYMIKNNAVEPKGHVIAKWRQTRFLRDQPDPTSKGWLLSIMRCIERLNSNAFTLEQCYQFEDELRLAYPSNRHIRPKIRQQMQVLRDKGFIEFLGTGTYRLVEPIR